MTEWRPGADLATLRARAGLLAAVRDFFARRDVLEVDTPILGVTGGTDPAIECLRSDSGQVLQSSPEFFMKRLLAAGSGPIYQIARAFRADEAGRLHNPEFLLLEWYRPAFDDVALMDEIDDLLAGLLPGFPARRLPFRELVAAVLGVDPLPAADEVLAAALDRHFAAAGREADVAALTGGERVALLDLAYSEAVAATQETLFVHDFPPEQAALARLRRDPRGSEVAARFELLVAGIELANGYHELVDAAEQRRRFEADLASRRQADRFCPEIDERLLAALAAGLPDCAGVAVGLDRVLMLMMGAADIDAVLPFSRRRL